MLHGLEVAVVGVAVISCCCCCCCCCCIQNMVGLSLGISSICCFLFSGRLEGEKVQNAEALWLCLGKVAIGGNWSVLGDGAREIGSVLYCSALCRALRSTVLYNTVLESSAMERRHARGARVPRALAQYLAVGESPQCLRTEANGTSRTGQEFPNPLDSRSASQK